MPMLCQALKGECGVDIQKVGVIGAGQMGNGIKLKLRLKTGQIYIIILKIVFFGLLFSALFVL